MVAADPTARADKDGLTPLQQRLIKNQAPYTTFDELDKEEVFCAELSAAILALNEEQVDRFVKYVLQCPFIGKYLRKRYNTVYLQNLKSTIPPLSPIVVGLLTAMVLNLGKVKLGDRELLSDPILVQLESKDPDLWLELLYQTNWNRFKAELVERFELYGYETLALGRERWLDDGRCDLIELATMVQMLRDKLESKELKWMQDFIASKRKLTQSGFDYKHVVQGIGERFGLDLRGVVKREENHEYA